MEEYGYGKVMVVGNSVTLNKDVLDMLLASIVELNRKICDIDWNEDSMSYLAGKKVELGMRIGFLREWQFLSFVRDQQKLLRLTFDKLDKRLKGSEVLGD